MPCKNKTNGQVFTPQYMVNSMLNAIGFDELDLMNIKIMEPSFGAGVFLINIIHRMIRYAEERKIDRSILENALENNIFGIEKDPDLYNRTIQGIKLLLSSYGLNIKPCFLINGDTLTEYKRFMGQMDLVIGNPPYIRTHHMDQNTRDLVKEFQFGSGNTDLYVQFYDIGLQMLNENGTLCYISPNSFLKNTSQQKFRDYILENRLLDQLYNFQSNPVFEDADTYCCVCILSKKCKNNFGYSEIFPINELKSDVFVSYKDANYWIGKKWSFKMPKEKNEAPKIKDIATVQYGIATNADSVYIGKAYVDTKQMEPFNNDTDSVEYVFFNGYRIESAILRRCIKASKCSCSNKNTYIIFPYKYTDDSYHLLSEKELFDQFPKAYEYLCIYKPKLQARDMEKNTPWYAFARSQGIRNMNKPKLIIKHILKKEDKLAEIMTLGPNEVVYSGVFITGNIGLAQNILLSPDFKEYCNQIGKDMANGYVSINGKAISDFPIPTDIVQPIKNR